MKDDSKERVPGWVWSVPGTTPDQQPSADAMDARPRFQIENASHEPCGFCSHANAYGAEGQSKNGEDAQCRVQFSLTHLRPTRHR
jgi:hypothetical protein